MSKKTPIHKESKPLYKQSETIVIKRTKINFAPYNPKLHSKEKINQIKNNFKEVAFFGGIIWNSITGNLIDGHKRLTALDILHKYNGTAETDYDVKVEKAELDEKTEREQNVFQTSSVTDLDAELLADLIKDIDYEAAGLTDEDLRMIEVEVPDFEFAKNEIESDAIGVSKAKSAQERKEAIKQAKQNVKNDNEAAPYVTITFSSFESKAYFMERFGFDHYDLYIKGERFENMIERIE